MQQYRRKPGTPWRPWLVFMLVAILLAWMIASAPGQSCWGPSCPLPRQRPAPTQPAQQAHPATVRVVNVTGGASYYGTGTCIEHNGQPVILTCGHLFREGTGRIELRLPNGRRVASRLLGVDQVWDLAVLSTDGSGLQVAVLAAEYPRKGERVTFGGYGSDGRYRVRAGLVRGYRRAGSAPRSETLIVSGRAADGDSGGPMFNARGRLVAVLWGTDGREACGTFCGRVRKFLARILGVPVSPVKPIVPVPAQPTEAPPFVPPVAEPPAVVVPAKPSVPDSAGAIVGLGKRIDGLRDNVAGLKQRIGKVGDRVGAAATSIGEVKDKLAGVVVILADLRETAGGVTKIPAAVPTAWYVGLLAALGWTGPPAVAVVIAARIGAGLIRRRRAKRNETETAGPEPVKKRGPLHDDYARQLQSVFGLSGRSAVADATLGREYDEELQRAAVSSDATLARWAMALRDRVAQKFYRIHEVAPSPAEPIVT